MAASQPVEAEGVPDPMTGPEDPIDDKARAAEYVLHLLDASERQVFEARLRDEADLRALVYEWEAHFAPIADEIAPVDPPASVKAAVMSSIAPELPQAASSPWRWLTGFVALGAAAVVAFVLLGPVLRDPGNISPSFQAELAAADGSLVLVAGVIPATHEIVIDRLVGGAPAGRVLELWLIAEGASAPVSLGLLEAEGTTRIRVPDEIAPGVRSGTIAISDEPPGGSPTGAPTGTILATGTFVDL